MQFYSASFLGDIREVVAHVGARYPDANLYAVGWSLGANILVNYLAKETCRLAGAASLCNPFNLVIADEDFRKGFNNIYDKALTKSLRRIFKKHALLFEDIGGEFNIELAANARTVREFDDGLTRVSFGFKSVDEYYSHSSSSDSIKHVRKPLLCIQAANDPIAPARGIPRGDIMENRNCLLIVTPKGGHLGWVAGGEAPFGAPWTDPIVMDFLEHLEGAGSSSSSSSSSSPVLAEIPMTAHHLE
ncbi:Embryogenesis-associated protein EMB8 [Linum perenne]